MVPLTKETIIIVHGTWAAPKSGLSNWYEPAISGLAPGSFVAKLDSALDKRGSSARCWAHCKASHEVFYWSGANHWVERTVAAAALAKYLTKLSDEGWRYHILAHSHGGNILVDALSYMSSSQGLGKIVTMGTPYINTSAQITKAVSQREKLLHGWVNFLLMLPTTTFILWLTDNHISSLSMQLQLSISIAVSLAIVLGISYIFGKYRTRSRKPSQQKNAGTDFLAISSPMDEAWQILHHLRLHHIPFFGNRPFLSYLRDLYKHDLRNRFEIAKAHGAMGFKGAPICIKLLVLSTYAIITFAALTSINYFGHDIYNYITTGQFLPSEGGHPAFGKAAEVYLGVIQIALSLLTTIVILSVGTGVLGPGFFSAFCAPLRWSSHRLLSINAIFRGIGTSYVRKRGWNVIQIAAMGLDGYAYKLPQIDRVPNFDGEKQVRYEDLPEHVERRALSARAEWLTRNFGEVSRTFAKLVVTAGDITSLMHTIAADQSLVHGSYYTDDDCIARIADWIISEDGRTS